MRLLPLLAGLVAALSALSGVSNAETIVAYATLTGGYTGTASSDVVLDDPGHTSLTFKTNKDQQLVKITYNAECSTLGAINSYTSIAVNIDGVQSAPASGTDFRFCTADPSGHYLASAVVRQAVITVPSKGTHTAAIRVNLVGGATLWQLKNSSIVIEKN